MQNKRGISQAFQAAFQAAVPGHDAQRVMRRATVFDVFDISAVLTASIRDLCQADHQNDPAVLADWLDNKTPGHIRTWLGSPGEFWVIEQGGCVAAVGAIGPVRQKTGLITLNYVAPDFRFQGISAAMLSHLEARLSDLGAVTAQLEATSTARSFYEARGWRPDTSPCGDCRAQCQAMTKAL